jgi:DinB family protein
MDNALEKLRQAVEDAMEELSNEDLSWHPPGKWCAAEVLEHLYLTYTATVMGLERVLAGGKPIVHPATFGQRCRTLVVVGLSYMPEGRKSPRVAQPRGVPAEKVRAEISAKIEAMDEIIRRCEESFGGHTKLLDHPILGPLTAAQWRKLHLVHSLHHVKQLRRLRRRREQERPTRLETDLS